MESLTNQYPQYDHKTYHRDEVYRTLVKFSKAIRDGDIDHIMSFYSDDVVAYDMMPPLEFSGKDNYKQSWQDYFTNYFKFPIQHAFEKQRFFIEGNIAFTHSLVHMSGNLINEDKKMDIWMRNTTCLKKHGNTWLITHEHNSVPLDNEMKGLTELHPVNLLH